MAVINDNNTLIQLIHTKLCFAMNIQQCKSSFCAQSRDYNITESDLHPYLKTSAYGSLKVNC